MKLFQNLFLPIPKTMALSKKVTVPFLFILTKNIFSAKDAVGKVSEKHYPDDKLLKSGNLK